MMDKVNQLPKDWRWVKLGDAVIVLDNLRKPINSSERLKRNEGKSKNELFPYYGATGQVGWIDSFITNGEYILVGEDGAPFLDIYKEKAYKIKGKTWVNNHAHILQELKSISTNDFILHYLNSINYRQYVNGTTRLKLTKGSLVEIPLPLPPLPTQHLIVAKIEELFSELDKGIENLRLAQQQLKTYRQAVLKWAFEGRLTNQPIDREGENLRAGELPTGWKWVMFGELFSESPQNGLYKPSTEYGSGIPIIRIDGFYEGAILNDYQHKRVKLNNEETNRYQIIPGDILVNRVNSMPYLGKCGLVKHIKEKTVFESNIMKVRVNREIASPEYITMYLSSKKGISELRKNAKQAVNQASINQTDVSNVKCNRWNKI
jgi:type I restriction enzyme S subunit